MRSSRFPARGRTPFTLVAVALVLGLAVLVGRPGRDARAAQPGAAGPAHTGHAMSDAAMERCVREFYATHPVNRGRSAGVTVVAADTFTAAGFRFDTDGNSATPVDTARIMEGETIFWKLVSGFHTVTSGTGSGDPNVGADFDVPLDSGSPAFSFTYTSAGTFPFFCRNHELFNMRGVVVVRPAAGVWRDPAPRAGLGFIAGPWPAPTRAGVSYRFALTQAGPARAEVLDVNGRRVTLLHDGWLELGSYAGAWDGRTRAGSAAPAGVYYLRLSLPGYGAVRRVVIAR